MASWFSIALRVGSFLDSVLVASFLKFCGHNSSYVASQRKVGVRLYLDMFSLFLRVDIIYVLPLFLGIVGYLALYRFIYSALVNVSVLY